MIITSKRRMLLILILSIFPIIEIYNYDIPVLYFLSPICIFYFYNFLAGKFKLPNVLKNIIIIFTIIIVEIFISTIFGSIELRKILIPTDTIQYIVRILWVVTFAMVFLKTKIETEDFIKTFLIVLVLGMSIGILQLINWPGRVPLLKLYDYKDGTSQLAQLTLKDITRIRIHGVSQFATSNGGLAAFAFIFGYSIYFYLKKFKTLSILLMIFSVINIFISQARAGLLMFFFAIITFYFLHLFINININKAKDNKKITYKFMFSIGLSLVIICLLAITGISSLLNKMLYRFKVLYQVKGGARMDQMEYGLSLIDSIRKFLFGISRAVQNQSAKIFYIEVEPVNIFVLYGALGFILQYFLVAYLLYYFIKTIKVVGENKSLLALLVASFVGLLSYQVFSVGYFFFREIHVGLFPWILMGVTIGVCEKYKILNNIYDSGQTESKIISFLYSLLYKLKNRGSKFYLLVYRLIKLFINLYFPVHYRLFHVKNGIIERKTGEEDVIISLTSFPARIDSIWLCIESLLRQTHKPNRIILWLAETQFENKDILPNKLLKLQDKGLEIKFCDDLRSHKKYYYTMKENPNSIVITVDDDMFYPENLVDNLLKTHRRFPDSVCCNLAHRIVYDDNSEITSYTNWKKGTNDYIIKPSNQLFQIGCQGVLYPPRCIEENVFNLEDLKTLCPLADDIWLKAMTTLRDIKTVKVNPISIDYICILMAQKTERLSKSNVGDNKNDKQINNLITKYPQLKELWKD